MKTQMEMYLEKLPEFFARYNGKIIAVRNGEFLGEYPSKLAAWKDMQKRS